MIRSIIRGISKILEPSDVMTGIALEYSRYILYGPPVTGPSMLAMGDGG